MNKPKTEKHYKTVKNALRYNAENTIYFRNEPYTGNGYTINRRLSQFYNEPCTLYLIKYGSNYAQYKLIINSKKVKS